MTEQNGNGTKDTLAGHRSAMDRFLERMRKSGNVGLSCAAAGIKRRQVYRWRDKFATFAKEWIDAKDDAVDKLDAEAWKRGTDGKSDRLLMFLLKAHRRDVYGDRQELDIKSENEHVMRIEYVNNWRDPPADAPPGPADSEAAS